MAIDVIGCGRLEIVARGAFTAEVVDDIARRFDQFLRCGINEFQIDIDGIDAIDPITAEVFASTDDTLRSQGGGLYLRGGTNAVRLELSRHRLGSQDRLPADAPTAGINSGRAPSRSTRAASA